MNADYIAGEAQQKPASPAQSSTLCFSNLEPWMDEEYVKRLCALMGWDGATVKIPPPPPDPATGHTVNNPGYCFLTFQSPAQAAMALAQVMPANPGATPMTMPNSSRPFSVNWANAASIPSLYAQPQFLHQPSSLPPPQPKEYSIFVGDLAPEASNSDLVAVFRNPMLGLRSDREPKFIRPFYSCKSAKIQLDPVTGLSKGYGFVRFTDQAEQQRALIEMHGLYCLSRPMRISPATAKSKTPGYAAAGPTPTAYDDPQHHQGKDQHQHAPSFDPHASGPSHSSALAAAAGGRVGSIDISPTIMEQIASLAAQPSSSSHDSSTTGTTGDVHSSITAPLARTNNPTSTTNTAFFPPPPNYPGTPSIESPGAPNFEDSQMQAWRQQQAQTRALLGSLMGPNGEQITSADPYNTTVFVGGLSPLVPEETLRTFFAPFGEIHYVKVPVGKHCGFVQFVHKADAERAIEKMQGFPIGGSKIRLSWGRSQYKAVQAAAAQVAAAAATTGAPSVPTFQPPQPSQPTPPPPPPPQQQQQQQQITSPQVSTLTQAEQIAQIAARQGGVFTPEQAAILLQLGYGTGWPVQQQPSNMNAPGDAQGFRGVTFNQQQQQPGRLNGQPGGNKADTTSRSPPQQGQSSYFASNQPGGQRNSVGMLSSMYPMGGGDGGDQDLDADAAAARISNSVSMSALGQGFSSNARSSRSNTLPGFAPFGGAFSAGNSMLNPSDGGMPQGNNYMGFGNPQQNQATTGGGGESPTSPSASGDRFGMPTGNSLNNSFSPFVDANAKRATGGFQISDLLRQDSQPLPRTSRSSVSTQGSIAQTQMFHPNNNNHAGAIGHKPSVDSISAALANMGFGESYRRPGQTSIWSHTAPAHGHGQAGVSPTFARTRAVAGSPHSSAGGSGNNSEGA